MIVACTLFPFALGIAGIFTGEWLLGPVIAVGVLLGVVLILHEGRKQFRARNRSDYK